MLGDGKQLDVGESHVMHVVRERRRELAVREPAAAFFRLAAPRPEMDLIDGHRRIVQPAIGAGTHPCVVPPGIVTDIPYLRGGLRPNLRGEATGIGFVGAIAAVARNDVIFIERAHFDVRDETFPDARVPVQRHRVSRRIPSVEVADHRHPRRIGRPDDEVDPGGPVDGFRMSAKLFPIAVMGPLGQEMEIEIGQ